MDVKQPISSQPQDTAPMQVLGGNKNANNCPIGDDEKRDWSFGLLDCSSRCDLYCQAVWCPCVVYSKNRQRMRHLQQHGAPLPGGGETFDKQCCIYAALIIPCYAWLMLKHSRDIARERYGIRADAYGNCLTAYFCRPCSLTQERREIELEENSFSNSK
ncbi:PLAC8-domain-containing protein [Russula vinacea]|nr:PLAC8-domain-containing protein [Russula vinacea]